jgi:sugar lactone lactonase YvrE
MTGEEVMSLDRALLVALLCALPAAPSYTQTITTIAGGGGTANFCGDGGPATEACLGPYDGIAVDADGLVYIADHYNNRIRRIDASGTITTVAGSGRQGFCGDNGPATAACLDRPEAVIVDPTGALLIADTENNRVRRVNPDGTISTVAGNGVATTSDHFCGDGGPATDACLYRPAALAFDSAGNLLIADRGNFRIREVDAAGMMSTLAGRGRDGGGVEGPALETYIDPINMVIGPDDTLYIVSYGRQIVTLDPARQTIRILLEDSRVRWAEGIARDAAGNLYISSDRVYRADPEGNLTAFAGNGDNSGFCGDNGPAIEACLFPVRLAIDPTGSLLISDNFNRRVRKVPSLLLEQTASPTVYERAGRTIQYDYIVRNIGAVPLAGPFVVQDSNVIVSCPFRARLQSGASLHCTGSYAITAGDVLAGSLTTTASAANSAVSSTPSRVTLYVLALTLALDEGTVVGCARARGVVTLSAAAPSGGVVVALTSDSLYAMPPATVKVGAGKTTARFTIATAASGEDQAASIGAVVANSRPMSLLTITPTAPKTLTLAPNPVIGGGIVAGTVGLPCAAGPHGVLLEIATDEAEVAAPSPSSVRIGYGVVGAAFAISTTPVSKRTGVSVTATSAGGIRKRSLTIMPVPTTTTGDGAR